MATVAKLLLSRFAVPAAGLSSFALIVVVYRHFPEFYADAARMLIFLPAPNLFGDWDSVLWSVKCWSEGANVYVVNTCSPLWQGDGFNYSPLLLRLAFLGASEPWMVESMFAIVALFYLSLATLPPPVRLRDQAIMLLAALSSSIWLGIERGNLDLVLFLLVVAALNLRLLALPCRLAGYALLIFAGLLKFYPFVALIVVLRERVSVLLGVAACAAAALVALIAVYHQELGWTAANLPRASYMNLQFGAANLAVVLGVAAANGLAMVSHQDPAAARAAGALVSRAALPLLTVLALLGATILARHCRLPSTLGRLSERQTGYLVAGAALICGCFFAVNSHVFRGMYLLLALPGLAALSREVAPPSGRRIFGSVCVAIPLVLWKPFFDMCLIVASHWTSPRANHDNPYDAFPGFSPDYWLWFANELMWWWIVTVLLAVLGAFAVRSDAWALAWRAARRAERSPPLGDQRR